MKTPVKVSIKVQRVAGAHSRVSIWNVNHLLVYFCGIGSSLIFFAGGRGTYQIEYIMFPCISWERSPLSHFLSREKIPCFREKVPPFQIVQLRSCTGAILFEKTIFSNIWTKYHISVYFFLRKIIFHFPPGGKIIFSEKRNIIFLDNTRKIKFQRDLFGNTIFPVCLKKENMVFRAVQHYS